jgi:hypothetical protein
MVTAEKAKALLTMHGPVRPQSPKDWKGGIDLPNPVARFFQQVGPVDITIESYGNPFFLPRLSGLWKFQRGYGWDGVLRGRLDAGTMTGL